MSHTDINAIKKLSVDDRLALIDAIRDTIDERDIPPPQLTEAQKAELGRRITAHKANPNEGVTWEEFQTQLRAETESGNR